MTVEDVFNYYKEKESLWDDLSIKGSNINRAHYAYRSYSAYLKKNLFRDLLEEYGPISPNDPRAFFAYQELIRREGFNESPENIDGYWYTEVKQWPGVNR